MPCRPRCSTAKCGRRGTLLVEMVVCTILLSVVAMILVPGLTAVIRQRQAIRFDTLAIIELENLIARHAVDTSPPRLSEWFQRRYPESVLEVLPMESSDSETTAGSAFRFQIRHPAGPEIRDVTRSVVVWGQSAEVSE